MHSFRIVVDNYSEGRLEAAWGLSILVETPGANILFDTGPSSNILESNLEALGIDPESIDCVVISHEHSDHASGLRFIASASPGIDVHVPQPSLEFFKKKFSGLEINFVGMGETEEICRDVFIVGPLYGPPFEQSLAIKLENERLALFLGCCHPKVINLAMEAVKELGQKLYSVVGGFHMGGSSGSECRETIKYLLGLGAEWIMPIHCSGEYIRLFVKKNLREKWIRQGAGEKIQLPIKSER
jgi:7,8-dihydropterin-6-yl-methyl-4-(beta-D-ribofuranosyl)aminobenzene 5'-phosphate synthase